MKLDSDTKDIMRGLIEDKVFDRRTGGLDIVKFLDENNQLDLWYLEVAIRYSTKFLKHALAGSTKPIILRTENTTGYLKQRGLNHTSAKSKEELDFIMFFKNTIIHDELTSLEATS